MAASTSSSVGRGARNLAWSRARRPWKSIGASLERFHAAFPTQERLGADPVQLAHAWSRVDDREVAALVASSLAFGRAASVVAKARQALEPFGPRLADSVAALEPGRLPPHLAGWTHRWISGRDLAWLLSSAGALLREHGSLGAAFRAGVRASDSTEHLLEPMARFAERLRSHDARPWLGSDALTHGAAFLVPVADGQAAAKRWCLMLRWMVRAPDGVDLGLWQDLGAQRLTIPLDTHVARIGAYIGLTDRATPGWAMAREITSNLARFDEGDPTRFDFALSHLGIMGSCPRRRDPGTCAGCDLVTACRL